MSSNQVPRDDNHQADGDGRTGSSSSEPSSSASASGDATTNTGTNSNTNSTQSSDTTTNPNRTHRTHLNIFDRFMDNFLDRSHRTPSGSTPTTDTPFPTNNSNSSSTSSTATNGTESTNTAENDDSRSIVITVNYVFSDENNPRFPNRAGSLIMSLPNNSSNRDPRAIQEFIRLATQMAYSSIINGLNKEKGITVNKFNSFPTVHDFKQENEENQDTSVRNHNQTCSICFENYDNLNKELSNIATDDKLAEDDVDMDSTVNVKKRKLHAGAVDPTDSRSNSRNGTRPSSVEPEQPSGQESSSTQQQYLSDYTGVFDHSAIKMPCGHIFGKECLSEWLKDHTTCPLCRSSVAEEGSRSQNDTLSDDFTVFNIPLDRQNDATTTTTAASATQPSASISTRPIPVATPAPATVPPPPPVGTAVTSPNLSSVTTPFYNSSNRFHYFGIANTGLNSEFESQPQLQQQQRQSQSQSQSSSHSTPSLSSSGPLANLLGYLRRPRSNNEAQPEPLFPTGMSSRRTANGIETFSVDSSDDIADLLNLNSLAHPETDNDDTNSNSNNDNDNDSTD